MESNNQKDNLNKLLKLIERAREHMLSYPDFLLMKDILLETGIYKREEFDALLQRVGYSKYEDAYDDIVNIVFKTMKNRTQAATLIGDISGSTYSTIFKLKA